MDQHTQTLTEGRKDMNDEIETVPKKMRLAEKDDFNKNSTILFQTLRQYEILKS